MYKNLPYVEHQDGDKKLHIYALRDWSWSRERKNTISRFWVTEIHVQDDTQCEVIKPGSFVFSQSQNARGVITELRAEIHIEPFNSIEGKNNSYLTKEASVNVHWIDLSETDPESKIAGEIISLTKLLGGDYRVRENHPFKRHFPVS